MGNNYSSFEWKNGNRFCQGTMKIENDNLYMTCTDTRDIEWLQDLKKICLQYDVAVKKALCIIEDIGSVATLKKNKIILNLKNYSAGHICKIYFWTDKCVASIKFKECTGVYNINGKINF